MENLLDELSLHIDGDINGYYQPVVKSIRDILESIKEMEGSQGGAIIFFKKKKDDEGDLMMKVFPFKKNIQIIENAQKGLHLNHAVEIFKKINHEKPYQLYNHYVQFKEFHNTDEHFSANLPSHNVITFDQTQIKFHVKDIVSGNGVIKNGDWDEFFQSFYDGLIEKNTYEQLLFKSGCKEVSFIPIPVLSTPSILLVLNQEDLRRKRDDILKSIYFYTRETVTKYLYSRLLDSLNLLLEIHGENWKEEDLVNAFVQEICHVILPISYSINGDKDIYYYADWPSKGFKSEYVLPLSGDKQYNIVFNLTSFHYVNLDDPHASEWAWINDSHLYKSNTNQSALLICKLFDILYKNWKLLRSAKKRAYEEILTAIGRIDILGLKKTVENIEQEFKTIENNNRELGSKTRANQLIISDNNNIQLFIDNEEIINSGEVRGSDQISGFIYLKYILEESKKETRNIDYSELFASVDVPKRKKYDPDIKSKKRTAIADIHGEIRVVCSQFISFANKYEEKVRECLTHRRICSDSQFNESLYLIAELSDRLKSSKIMKDYPPTLERGEKLKFDSAMTDIPKLLELYKKERKVETLAAIRGKRPQSKLFFDKIAAAKSILKRDENGVDQQDFVRLCFRALLLLLNKKKQQNNKVAKVSRLLTNLKSAGLINDEETEIASQTSYSYNQKGIDCFIDWTCS